MKNRVISFVMILAPGLAWCETNPLLGRWGRGSKDNCSIDAISFEANAAKKIADADGDASSHVFKKVAYKFTGDKITGEMVVVDFGERHSFGLSADPTHVTFKVVAPGHIQLVGRRNKTQDFFKCL